MGKVKNSTGYYFLRMKNIWTIYLALNYSEVYRNLIKGANGVLQVLALIILVPLIKVFSPLICLILTIKMWSKIKDE